MTPEDALRFWEEAHHPLSEVHRESFKKRVEQLGLTEYLSSWFKAAVRQEKRLIDVAELLEEQNRERQALKGRLNEYDYTQRIRAVLPAELALATPRNALRAWEATHHELTEVHRESFMKRVEELGLSDYKLTEFANAIRETKLLTDVQKMLEEQEPF